MAYDTASSRQVACKRQAISHEDKTSQKNLRREIEVSDDLEMFLSAISLAKLNPFCSLTTSQKKIPASQTNETRQLDV